MANPDFVMAVPPGGGEKRLVPVHYLENPAFGYKLPPSERVTEPAATTDGEVVREPAAADATGETVEEPAAATTKTTKRTGAAGETKEA